MAHRNVQRRLLLTPELFRVLALCATAGLLLTASRGPETFSGVSIKILDASAPPGGTIQLSVTLTEPKPNVTGTAALSFDAALLGPVMGLALYSSSGRLATWLEPQSSGQTS